MNLRSAGVGVIFFLAANMAQAVYNINIDQVGPDVVMSGSGSIVISPALSSGSIGPCLLGGDGLIYTNALCIGTDIDGDRYLGVLTPGISLPSAVASFGSSSFGPNVFLLGNDLYLPPTYASGSPLVNQSTYAGTTLAALGLTVGTQTLFVPSGDEIVINIGLAPPAAPATPASIPTLGEYALLGMSSLLAMLGIAAVSRKRG
ncbi:MAG: IPTL-CTERM sorting domain-containing protein [Acidovorax sp.]|uniref:IPTL-CTERM sorting domain-containing protein n=1 Tax=Acidovorax sp. TaxID=1872122 RepID=UPI00391C7E69